MSLNRFIIQGLWSKAVTSSPIFISYRHADTRGDAGRLTETLKFHFGDRQAFRDITSIPAGVDFVEAINSAVSGCAVLLAIIGPNWLKVTDNQDRRRLDDPNDFVRLEIGAALQRNIRVIPVLVGGAAMPTAETLPEELQALARRQAQELSDARWDFDVKQLIETLESAGIKRPWRSSIPISKVSWWKKNKIAIGIGGVLLMIAGYAYSELADNLAKVLSYSVANLPSNATPEPTRATTRISSSDLQNGIFLGIAMSGGGSRAANFSAAALLEFESLGILQQATALSSVSGSSLTAAYYGLFSDDKIYHWNAQQVRERLVKNFEVEWLWRWFLPWNIARYWITGFDRSDIMADVFDYNLFENRTFRHMPHATPKILINATSLTENGASFLFTDEAFNKIGSGLDRYGVSRAVMASSAVPGAFHNVTLRDYTQPKQYVHLFDGGPSDNLGINSLRRVARELYLGPESEHPKKCLILIVDAYTEGSNLSREDSDTRKAITDFVLDTNALEASSVLLASRRHKLLEDMGIRSDRNRAPDVYQPFFLFAEADDPELKKHPRLKDVECHAWLITFQRLQHLTHLPNAGIISAIVSNIPTRYTLLAPDGLGADEAQDALFNAAEMLIKEDKETLAAICKDFGDNFPALKCAK